MHHRRRAAALVSATAMAVVIAGGAFVASAHGPAGACESGGPTTERNKIGAAKLIVEYNFTDGDIGVHGLFEDDGWKSLCVFDPTGEPVLEVGPASQLRRLGMAGFFFESREPPERQFSFEEMADRFPEGKYRVVAQAFDGSTLVGKATFTHDVPAPPTITAPLLAAEPPEPGQNPIPVTGLEVTWNPVVETVNGRPVDISGYEVIVTKEHHDDPHGFSRPIYDVHVPPTLSSLSVPAEFLEANTVYELEVLALEVSGNQTISVGFFRTA